MPNQKMANGTHASGDKLRPKLTPGNSAARATGDSPSHNPSGTPNAAASKNPQLARNSEATTSSNKRPPRLASTKPAATAWGEGKTASGTIFRADKTHQTAPRNKSSNEGKIQLCARDGAAAGETGIIRHIVYGPQRATGPHRWRFDAP